MTKEQADEMIALMKDIRGLLARVANSTSRDGTQIFYAEPAPFAGLPSHLHPK